MILPPLGSQQLIRGRSSQAGKGSNSVALRRPDIETLACEDAKPSGCVSLPRKKEKIVLRAN